MDLTSGLCDQRFSQVAGSAAETGFHRAARAFEQVGHFELREIEEVAAGDDALVVVAKGANRQQERALLFRALGELLG